MVQSISHHAKKVWDAVQSPRRAGVSALTASWCRSVQHHGLDPASGGAGRRRVDARQLKDSQNRHDGLLAAAGPVIEHIFRSVGRSGCAVVLSDRHGLIIKDQIMDGDRRYFHDVGLVEGALWGEAEEGTNGIGTCLAEARPLTIYRDQHFASRNIGMSCMGAPIYDPHGALIAALDVSNCRDDLGPAMAEMVGALVREAAGRIEREYFCQHFADHRIIFLPENNVAGTALLAADRDGLVVGASHAARLRLKIDAEMLRQPAPLDQFLGGDESVPNLDDGERSILRQAMARAGGNASKAAKLLGIGRATLYRRLARVQLRGG